MKWEQWEGFRGEDWQEHIDVRGFIQQNYTFYNGDESFLTGPTGRTAGLLKKLRVLQEKEREKGGVLDVDVSTVSSLVSYAPGYLDKENELIGGPVSYTHLLAREKSFGKPLSPPDGREQKSRRLWILRRRQGA